jgi:phosphoglycolate phosphatase
MLTGSVNAERAPEFTRLFVERADQCMAELTNLYPEVPIVLDRMHRAGLKTAIVSTKFRYRIEKILSREGLASAFDAIIGGEDVTHHKPHPEGLERAIARLGVTSDRTVYVGDHPVDADAARLAGAAFVAVLGGGISVASDFSRYDVAAFIESLAELPDALTKSNR